MINLRRPVRAAVPVLLLAAVLAGCADSPVTPATTTTAPPVPTTAAPATTAAPGTTTPGTGTPAPPTTVAAPAPLLWPVTDPARVAPLQQQVDSGSQPWLLDPAQVAVSFATAVHGWPTPQVASVDGATVVVTDPQRGRITLTLVQPGRTGPTGIWIVSTDRTT